jgi:hypothetical protein
VTAAFDLTEWRDAAVRGAFPRPARTERWQPLRAGLVNLWEYDAAEVWYAGGHLQLQGANESGKSTLMTLTTLLLLAGDTSSSNIDTLGQSDKRFRYYVEPTGHALDRRDAAQAKYRGWAWLEFGTSGSGACADEYFTLLLFAESRRPDNNLTLQWCTTHGSDRVRNGIALVNAGVISEPRQFRDLQGFTAHPSGTAYRDEIARRLYGTDLAWLDQLVRILRVVRTPHIGQRLDLRFLTTAIRHALPPIAQDEIDQLASGWEQLQRLRNERDATEQALAAVAEFNRQRWRPWADSVIRAAADPVAAITSRLTQITREEKTASDAVAKLTRESAGLGSRIEAEDQAMQLAAEQRDALRESKAYDDARTASVNAQQLAERAGAAETTAERSRKRAAQALEAIAPAEARRATARENFKQSQRAAASAADAVAGHAGGAGLVGAARRSSCRLGCWPVQSRPHHTGGGGAKLGLLSQRGSPVLGQPIVAAQSAVASFLPVRFDQSLANEPVQHSVQAADLQLDPVPRQLGNLTHDAVSVLRATCQRSQHEERLSGHGPIGHAANIMDAKILVASRGTAAARGLGR